MKTEQPIAQSHDFVIVGSGAGGGPLAANLALAGFTVLLIEAGSQEIDDNYSVPAFHALSTEDPKYSWEFFVKHYSEDNNPERDPKYHGDDSGFPGAPGIFYPRAAALGGCTSHHAMITVYPHESDWNGIAELVGDEGWNAASMRRYFDRIENAQYRDGSVLLKLPSLLNPLTRLSGLLRQLTASEDGESARGQKGSGWLSINQADPLLLLDDKRGVLQVVLTALKAAKDQDIPIPLMPGLNPNDPKVAEENLEGVNVVPISVHDGRRTGARERVLQARKLLRSLAEQGESVGRLDLVTNTFATNVVFADDDPAQAIGVRCVPGQALYEARHHQRRAGHPGIPMVYPADKEVILCGGAFNTPQLLMLSGIGAMDELTRHGIDVRVNSPGVGENLQDRYEVGGVGRADKPFRLLGKATFQPREDPSSPDPDEVFTDWRENGTGIYATNGVVLGIIKRSSVCPPDGPPDLYIFGIPGMFRGYEIGYSETAVNSKDCFTWAVLKGHTDNTSGYVRLKSADPFATPEIHFKYFEESAQRDDRDVKAVVEGLEFVREMFRRTQEDGVIAEQIAPKPSDDLEKFVRDNAWGHHASCTCKIGPDSDAK